MSSNKISNFDSQSSCTKTCLKTCHRNKVSSKTIHPKKVLSSKRVSSNTTDTKTCSTSFNDTKKKAKKTSKSENFINKLKTTKLDICKKCGDVKLSNHTTKYVKPKPCINKKLSKYVQQHYKNENYRQSTESLRDTIVNLKKLSLGTINENTEKTVSEDTIYNICSESDSSSEESIEDVKEFRRNNYFECHSSKFRIKNKGSVTSLGDHKCVFRFYLNSRLFPVPLITDHNGIPRCVECHLPMSYEKDGKINGTIQAKISMGTKQLDSTILLPIKPPLIIDQKIKESQKDEMVYFGVISLDENGHSKFNPNLPENSLALKYQYGYKEFKSKQDYVLNELDKNDVIII